MSEQQQEQQTVNIKERILGALVLVSLGVIFIPFFLNGGIKRDSVSLENNIPPMPPELSKQLPNIPQPMLMPKAEVIASYPELDEPPEDKKARHKEPTKTKVVKKQATKNIALNTTKKSTIKAKVKTPTYKSSSVTNNSYNKAYKPKTKKIDKAYAIQIASFSKKSNAFNLQNKLRKKKFKAYIESIVTAKGKVYRLRVGPYLKFNQIANIRTKIEKQFKLKNTVIVKYKT
jgi:DedD protein